LFEIKDTERKFPFKDARGGYELWELRNRNPRFNRSNRPNLYYPFYANITAFEHDHHRISLEKTSDSQIEVFPVDGSGNDDCWRWSDALIAGKKELGGNAPDLVARQTKAGKWTIWQRARKSTKSAKSILKGSRYLNEAGTTLLTAMGLRGRFDYPKPVGLLKTLIELATEEEDLILDSFTGSGTTGHAVLDLNKEDGGNRRFILVEMDQGIASDVTAERLRRVIKGYDKGGDKAKPVERLGGGFRYCRLGVPLFDEFGDIAGDVTFPDLAAHIFFSETGVPIPHRAQSEFLGIFQSRAVYLLFDEASRETPREAAGNVLTPVRLDGLPPVPDGFDGLRVIYGEGCTVSKDRLKAANAVFKQIPYQVDGV
jgi:hypothetical protein